MDINGKLSVGVGNDIDGVDNFCLGKKEKPYSNGKGENIIVA